MLYTFESVDGKSKIVFDMTFRNGATDAYMRKLEAAVKAAHDLDALDTATMEIYSWIICTTRRVTFDLSGGPAHDALAAFMDFWAWFKNTVALIEIDSDGAAIVTGLVADESILAEVWPRFRRGVSNIIQNEWYAAANNAQRIFASPDVLAPLAVVAPDKKADPDFLANAGRRVKKSAAGRSSKRTPVNRARS